MANKTFDLSLMGVATMVSSSDVYRSEVDRFNGKVSDERLASHLAAITTSDKASDAFGIAKAYHAWAVTKEDAKREGFKSEADLLMNLTGLGKSAVSQLRVVGAFFADKDGNFTVPDEMRGYTVGQIYEVVSKCKGVVDSKGFATVTAEKGINAATSAKAIRKAFDGLTEEERKGANHVKAMKAAVNKLANDGITFTISDKDNKDIMEVALLRIDESVTKYMFEKIENHEFTVTLEWK